MAIAWGYSPKIEKYIPLGDFPADKYLIIAAQAAENLGWKISHVSEVGIIAYSSFSWQSYSEEISIKIEHNFAIVKSECIGIQMWFNDYGKNDINLEKFFHEFNYVEFHLKDVWDESLAKFHEFAKTQDQQYFEKAPLTAKNNIKNILYLFLPQQNYRVTPILILINFLLLIGKFIFTVFYFRYLLLNRQANTQFEDLYFYLGGNNRELVLNGQFWRLITHQFIHGSFFHLFFNMYALAYIGLMVEHKLGYKKYLSIYLLSGICGGVLSMCFHAEGYMVGASGAIMGLFGAFLALLWSKAFEKNATKALLISTVAVILLMLVSGLRGRVDNAAHVGGLVSGFLIAYILFNEKLLNFKLYLRSRYLLAFTMVIVVVGLSVVFLPNYQNREFNRLEITYQRNAAKFINVYKLKRNQPKEEKLKAIEMYGIKVWKKNDSIVKKMNGLLLNDRQSTLVDFHQKIVVRHLELVDLFYRQTVEDNPFKYNTAIQSLQIDINNVRLNANSKAKPKL